jgi:hypothetical protein
MLYSPDVQETEAMSRYASCIRRTRVFQSNMSQIDRLFYRAVVAARRNGTAMPRIYCRQGPDVRRSGGAMPSDSEVRDVVRQLMRRFDSMDARYASFLHVVAKKDPEEYTRLTGHL